MASPRPATERERQKRAAAGQPPGEGLERGHRRAEPLPDHVLEPKTAADRHERDRLIYRARANLVPWPAIAAQFGVSEVTCRDAARRYRERERADLLDRQAAEDLIHEMLGSYEEALGNLAGMMGGGQPSVRLGAIRASLEVHKQRAQLLSELNVLPRDLGAFAVERDLMATAHRIVAVLEEHDVPEEVQLAVMEAVSPESVAEVEGEAEEVPA